MSNNFEITLNWHQQDKPFTYNEYSREYTFQAGSKPKIIGSAAPDYKGDATVYNPEEMLIAAISACHMLSYLALAANAKIEVLSYQDQAGGSLERQGMSMKFKEVTLRPKIEIAGGSDEEKATALHDKAHHICFIANSVNFPVHIEPEIKVC